MVPRDEGPVQVLPKALMGTKESPGDFDCYANAKSDEPMFVLLARDPSAPEVIEEWARLYAQRKALENIIHSKDPALTEEQGKKLQEAFSCADRMRLWRRANPDV